jgi:outer membrane protein TolC
MRKKAFEAAILVLAVLAAAKGHCDTPPESMNLSRSTAVAMAIQKNLDLRVTALNSAMARTDVARSRGLYDPFLSASANGGVSAAPGDPLFRTKSANASIGLTQLLPTGGNVTFLPQTGFTTADFGGDTETTTDWQSSVGLTVSQPLLRNAGKEATEVTITLAASALEDSLEQFRFATIDTVFAVTTSYNRLFTLRETLDSRKAALFSAQDFLNEIRQRAPNGSLQAVEIANTEYAIAQRRRDLVEAERNVRDQESSLRYLLGMQAQTPIIPIDPPSREEPMETGEEAVQAALAYRPDLKQFRSTLKTSQLLESVARRQKLPDLSITAGGGLTGTGGSFSNSTKQIEEDPGTFWSAGLFFSVPIGNTAARNDYRRSKIRTAQVHDQIAALEWRIRDEVESDMRALISARLQMQTADQSLQYAVQRLDGYRQNVRLGTATVQDVINAENDLISARISQRQALETFAFSVAKLWRDTGVLLDRQNIHIDISRPEKLSEGPLPVPAPVPVPPLPVPAGAGPKAGLMPPESETMEQQISPAGGEQGALPGEGKGQTAEGEAKAAGIAVSAAPWVPQVAAPAETGTFTLMVGEFVTVSAMADAKEKVIRAGLSPLVTAGPKREVPMTRLHLGEFPNQKSARKGLDKLRRAGADGFILRNKEGRYDVYDGSYSNQEGAAREQERLADRGIKVSQKKVSVPMPMLVLTAGSFPTREAALQEAEKLERQGLKAVVIKNDTAGPMETNGGGF